MKVKVFHSNNPTETRELNLTHLIQEGESCFVGRSQYSALMLDSPDISRLHGRFSYQDGQYYFCDLGSSNGSMIQGETAEVNREYLLQPGDIIRLGDFVLLLESSSALPEELPQTVVGNLDATVLSGYADLDAAFLDKAAYEDENIQEERVVQAEVVTHESSALVKLTEVEVDYSLQHQTKALFTAINQRVVAELRAASSLTRDTYLKAIRKARKSIEQERLIDPNQFEKEAEKHWQSLAKNTSKFGTQVSSAATKGASNLSQRLGVAAKAAWHEFLRYQPRSSQETQEVVSRSDSASTKQSSEAELPNLKPEKSEHPAID